MSITMFFHIIHIKIKKMKGMFGIYIDPTIENSYLAHNAEKKKS